MQIISHRGFWLEEQEKNSSKAFIRSFISGFGLETDVRDHNGALVISHDPPQGKCLSLENFIALYQEHASGSLPLALNIKADGLQNQLKETLRKHNIDNYFVFDMSAPDTLLYLQAGLKIFTRQSEIEPEPICYPQADGVWLDCFNHEWMEPKDIKTHLTVGKKACLVSPELHKRPYEEFWQTIKTSGLHLTNGLMLCTDFPQLAKDFFQ